MFTEFLHANLSSQRPSPEVCGSVMATLVSVGASVVVGGIGIGVLVGIYNGL